MRVILRNFIIASFVLLIVGFFFRGPAPHIALPAELVFTVPLPLPLPGFERGIPIYNTVIAAWVTMAVLLFIAWRVRRSLTLVPAGRSLQNIVEFVLEAILDLCRSVAGEHNGRRFFPLVATIFLFIMLSNWLGLLPGYLTIGFVEHADHGPVWKEVHIGGLTVAYLPPGAKEVHEGEHDVHLEEGETVGALAPFLRSAATNLNTPLALAIIAMFMVEFWGIKDLGLFRYGSRFFNIRRLLRGDFLYGIIDFFVGVVEFISELARLVSLTFRLFGNIFAGEVLLGIVGFLVPWALLVVFYGLELFVGFIQALIFAILTLIFSTMAVTAHEEGEGAHESGHH